MDDDFGASIPLDGELARGLEASHRAFPEVSDNRAPQPIMHPLHEASRLAICATIVSCDIFGGSDLFAKESANKTLKTW